MAAVTASVADEEAIFTAARRLAGDERAAYLRKDCGGDDALLRRVEALLAVHDGPSFLLDHPPLGSPETASFVSDETPTRTSPAAPESPGAVVGPYKLLRKIGEGGMGTVYLAEQSEPIQRKVALKVIKPGMDSRQVVARFEAERQALAMMDHANIARVLDAGATASGRPYFVMELIHGVPITQYCDDNHLTPRERLELFVPVCQAIQHAHQKGIIHRDIKPSNVMVTLYDGKPVPKVIDFGVAKAVERSPTERTLFTQFGTMLGTPQYMSPEQAEMSALGVDTRSDIYSLGVLLYELLTGSTPLTRGRIREAAYGEIVRIIKEEEPPKPSTRLSESGAALASISAVRKLEPAKLSKLVRGELDWIVMKSLEKDRSRRYETASGFAADVQRYLDDEPVLACPPSARYRAGKFARRNQGPLLAAAALLAMVAVGTGVSLGQAAGAREARRQAETDRDAAKVAEERAVDERAAAQAIGDFFENDVLLQADGLMQAEAGHTPQSDLTVKQALDRAAGRIGGRFETMPKVEGSIRNTLGVSYLNLGQPGPAIAHLERAASLCEAAHGPDSPLNWLVAGNLGSAYLAAGRHADAVRTLERARAGYGGVGDSADAKASILVAVKLAQAYVAAGRLEAALPMLDGALVKALPSLGIGHPAVSYAAAALATIAAPDLRRNESSPIYAGAVETLRRVREEQRATLGPRDLHTLRTAHRLAEVVLLAGSPLSGKEAEALLEEALAGLEATRGPQHPETLAAMENLGIHYLFTKPEGRGIALMERAVEGMTAALGPTHPSTLSAMETLARFCAPEPDRRAKALALRQQVAERYLATKGADHEDTREAKINLASSYMYNDRPAEAVSIYEDMLRRRRVTFDGDSARALRPVRDLGQAYRASGQWEKLSDFYKEWLGVLQAALPPGHPETLDFAGMYADAARQAGRPAEALGALEGVLKATRKASGADHADTLAATLRLAEALNAAGQWDAAAAHVKRVVEVRTAGQGREAPETVAALQRLAGSYRAGGRWEESEKVLRQLLETFTARRGPDHPDTFNARLGLAVIRQYTGHLPEAIAELEKLRDQQRDKLKPDAQGELNTLRTLGRAYLQAGRAADAEPVLREALTRQQKLAPASQGVAGDSADLAMALLASERYKEAEPLMREALKLSSGQKPGEWQLCRLQHLLGAALAGQGKVAEAEPLMVGGCEGMLRDEARIPGPWRWHLTASMDRVVRFYTTLDKPEEVAKWRARRAKYPRPKETPPEAK